MQWSLLSLWLFYLIPAFAHPSSADSIQELAFELAHEVMGTRLEKRSLQCISCQYMLAALKKLPKERAREVANSYLRRKHRNLKVSDKAPFNFATDLLNALSLMDPMSDDGRYMCHYLMGKSCTLPATPNIDYQQLMPPKPPGGVAHIQSQGRKFKVLHVSDIHLELNYTIGAPANCIGAMCCGASSVRDPFAELEPAPRFGAYKCDCPEDLLFSALQDISVSDNVFDFALFTGDMVDHDPFFMSKELCIAEEETSMRALKAYLGDVPVYAVLGNHDSYPFSQDAAEWTGFAPKFSFNSDLMSHLWTDAGWLGKEQAKQIKRHHGAYSIIARPGLKVIALNTNFWYVWNFYNYAKTGTPDPSGMLSFVIDELAECERTGKRAWIIGHVPPGGLPDETLPIHSEFFAAILERFNETLAATFFGHTHRDEFTVLYANNATDISEQSAVLTAFMAPSVTPFTNMNPGWRYYDIDADTFEVLDIKTYYTNLQDYRNVMSVGNDTLDWKLGYSARDIYGRHEMVNWPHNEPLNAVFWHRVSQAILVDPEMAQLYTDMAMRKSPFVPKCDLECRQKQFCYTSCMTTPQVMRCRAMFEDPNLRSWEQSIHSGGVGASHYNNPLGKAGKPLQQVFGL